MTRGKIAIIDNQGIKVSTEFNGDMYLPMKDWVGYGLDVIVGFNSVYGYESYEKFILHFNDLHFNYRIYDGLIFEIRNTEVRYKKLLNFTDDYYGDWFSDYVYLKNVSDNVVVIKAENQNEEPTEYDLESGEIMVLNFGRKVDYEKEIRKYFESMEEK